MKKMHELDCNCNMHEALPPGDPNQLLISGGMRTGLRIYSSGWRSLVLPTNWVSW